MFNQGLSLDQAPPIGVVLRFFLTAPLFGVLAALGLMFAGDATVGHWEAPRMVAVIHWLVLGVAGQTMIGALFQMLPVIAGAPIKAAEYHARWIHALMSLGVLMLSGALWMGQPFLFHPALALLLGSLGFTVGLMLLKLLKVENKTPSVVGMIVALLSLGLGLIFATLVTLVFMGVDIPLPVTVLRALHLHFMLFGWIAVLVMAVAFQVIEMFYVTPPYPEILRQWLPIGILSLLVLQVPAYFMIDSLIDWIDGVLGVLLVVFASVTLRRLSQRKRPVADTTVWLWRIGMVALALSAAFYIGYLVLALSPLFDLTAVGFGLFFLSVIFAMSYKIIPFLVWFHLNAKGVMETPMMGDIVPARNMRWHLWLHGATIATALSAALLQMPSLWRWTGVFLLAEVLIHGANLLKATIVYNKFKDKGIL